MMLFRFILLLLYIKLDDVSIFVCFFLVRRLKREIAGVSKIVNYEHESFRLLNSLCPLVVVLLLLLLRLLLLSAKEEQRERERETNFVF